LALQPKVHGDRVEAGLDTGPSHTTGHAVFRIRRLSPAVSLHREVYWNLKNQPVTFHIHFIQRFHSQPFVHASCGPRHGTFGESTPSCRIRPRYLSSDFGLYLDELWSLVASLFRGSSALRSSGLSTTILTTMASADFSRALPREISPSKVRNLSARAVRLYMTCLSVALGFRACQHAHRPCPASLPIRVPTVVPLLAASSGFASRLPLAVHYGFYHYSRSTPFS